MYPSFRPEEIIRSAEAFDDSAPADLAHRLVYGIAVPLMIAGLGIWRLAVGTVPFAGGRPATIVWYEGAEAKLIISSIFAIAVFAHFHYFWGGHPHFHALGYLGKAASLLVVVAVIVAFVYRVLVLG